MKKSLPHQVWKTMSKKELHRLAVAVFFLFATIGPLSVLMDSNLYPASWIWLIIQTIVSGAFSACIILFMGKPVKLAILVIVFITFQLTTVFWEQQIVPKPEKNISVTAGKEVVFSSEELSEIQTKRTVAGLTALFCIALGYGLFVRVVGKENKRRAEAEAELSIAKKIQESLLPSTLLQTPWCSIAGASAAAAEVGGDYYDVIQISEEKILVVIADASGHGVGAGILTAMTKSCIVQELQHSTSPAKILEQINKTIFTLTERKMFVTCALALLDKKNMTAKIATAGHPPVLQLAKNGFHEIRSASIGLGLLQSIHCSEFQISLQQGDRLFLFTDGILEAMNDKQEQFGFVSLHALLRKHSYQSSAEICRTVVNSVTNFSKELSDDATFVAITIAGE